MIETGASRCTYLRVNNFHGVPHRDVNICRRLRVFMLARIRVNIFMGNPDVPNERVSRDREGDLFIVFYRLTL